MIDRLIELADDMANRLEVKRPKLLIDPNLPTMVEVTHNALFGSTICFININTNQLGELRLSPTFALAHEMRHVWQLETKILRIVSEGYVYWDGELTYGRGSNEDEHSNLPHEKDANEWAERFVLSLLSKSA